MCGPGLHLRPEQRHVGYVAQEGALFPHLTVADNIAFGLSWRQRRAASPGRGTAGHGRSCPSSYAGPSAASAFGGEQQRIALARALAPSRRWCCWTSRSPRLDAALRAETRAGRGQGSGEHRRHGGAGHARPGRGAVDGRRSAVLRDGALVQMATQRRCIASPPTRRWRGFWAMRPCCLAPPQGTVSLVSSGFYRLLHPACTVGLGS